VAASSSITPHAVRISSTLLSSNRHITKESYKRLLTSDGCSAVISATSKVNSTVRVNKEGLKVGRALGKQLASLNSRTSHNRRIVTDTSTKDSVV
jgi:hypothetical protein